MSGRYRLLLAVPALMVTLSACSFSGSVSESTPEAAAPGTTTAAPASSSPAPVTTTTEAAPHPEACPSAKTFEGLTDKLPAGWSFTDVTCAEGWAAATPKGPSQGDGVYLFQKTGTTWKYHSQGSGFDCKDLGIDEAPFCIS